MNKPLSIAVLGSTGSVGTQTLSVVRGAPERFAVLALTAGKNIELLLEQVREFQPRMVGVESARDAEELRRVLPSTVQVCDGPAGLEEAARCADVELVLVSVVGFAGLAPVLAALEAGKIVALANKESLVAGGPIVSAALQRSAGCIIPVDSEHSSIYQCLCRRGINERPRRVIITASGGPFLHATPERLRSVTPEEAVKHPRWRMGAKISVDSATLMNKGLEVIEAAHLFALTPDEIEVLVHPQSVVHGFVEYSDSAMIAALFNPDMRVPIAYALNSAAESCAGPGAGFERCSSGVSPLDLASVGTLEFLAPDLCRFPLLALCYDVLRQGGLRPCVLNGANEIAVQRFLARDVRFDQIPEIVTAAVNSAAEPLAEFEKSSNIKGILGADAWARGFASEYRVTELPAQ